MLTENELIKFRRELHSYPETGWCEFVTTHKIVEKLRSFGLDPIMAVRSSIPSLWQAAILPKSKKLRKQL